MNTSDNQQIMVSIVCNTYNQEKYIGQALKGFVSQKTSFAFEILVHDDASTDSTPAVIREYEKEYPGLVLPIYQKENQYSKRNSITHTFQLPRARGKYIAFCEGDDYWTDENKLQIQVDAMEKNPDINICAHTVTILKEQGEAGFVRPFTKDCIASMDQVILFGGSFVGTCSLLYRHQIDKEMPPFRREHPLDYTMQIHGAMDHGLLFLNRNMGVYRLGSIGSWTERVLRNPPMVVKHYDDMVNLLEELDHQTKNKYHKVIDFAINEYYFKRFYALKDKTSMKKIARKLRFFKNRRVYQLYGVKTAIKTELKYLFPFLYEYLHKV